MALPSTLFEEMGFHYVGPVDGHDLPELVRVLATMKEQRGPQLLHVITRKGKGYERAEGDQIEYHAVGPFDPSIGVVKKSGPAKLTYTQVFGDWLCDMAAVDAKLAAITPAMREGSGLVRFSQEYPQRYFDVAIAEQHAVTLAAGMACEGMKPVVAIYSTFLQRGYDQLIHDVALQNLDVLFAIDRGGVVGPDGATHAGSFDLSFLRCIPNMVVMAPAPRLWLKALTRKRARPSISNEKSHSRNSSYCLRWLSFMMSYTMLCTILWSSGSTLILRTSPCTRIMGGSPAERWRSEALFLTLKASSWVMSIPWSRAVLV